MLSTLTMRDTEYRVDGVDHPGEARRAPTRPPPRLRRVGLWPPHERAEDPEDREEDSEEEHPPVSVPERHETKREGDGEVQKQAAESNSPPHGSSLAGWLNEAVRPRVGREAAGSRPPLCRSV